MSTGMVVLQAESEISSINMVYGGASTGKRVMTSSSSPGISLMSEGLSYLAGAELPCLIVNCQRGGPGLGTIQPSQGDYFQACKGGGHGDFHMIVLAPNSVQEMHDHVRGLPRLEFHQCLHHFRLGSDRVPEISVATVANRRMGYHLVAFHQFYLFLCHSYSNF